ncbi:hypothetical protein CAEBREN_05474 [Caenorhabditis brenneri]|uniref:Uncharacterized protein n=1 Tax=Caenorhabditis brenneri TaxID=135651 RepID=G0N4M3_CAEBE|nr:hypothetical protein CAEBREN_05474 [Caenorhabditis brenneri]
MSARDVMAAMLDELMGPKRNVELGSDTKVTFDDPNICPYYLVGFCPHDMFTNTKADLGACQLVHDDNLRRMYPESIEYGQLGFERRLLRFLVQLDEDNLRRIRKNKDKLAGIDDNGRKKIEEEKRQIEKDIDSIDEELRILMKAAEQAGNEGNISKCQEMVAKSEQLESEKRLLKDKLNKINEPQQHPVPPVLEELAIKPMEVCEVCGSMLIVNDAQQRVEEHLTGKMHTGFQKIRTMIQHLKEKIKELEEADETRRETRRKEKRVEETLNGERESTSSSGRDKNRRRRSRSPLRSGRDERPRGLRDSRGSRDSRESQSRRDRDHRHHDRGYDHDRQYRDRRY